MLQGIIGRSRVDKECTAVEFFAMKKWFNHTAKYTISAECQLLERCEECIDQFHVASLLLIFVEAPCDVLDRICLVNITPFYYLLINQIP